MKATRYFTRRQIEILFWPAMDECGERILCMFINAHRLFSWSRHDVEGDKGQFHARHVAIFRIRTEHLEHRLKERRLVRGRYLKKHTEMEKNVK